MWLPSSNEIQLCLSFLSQDTPSASPSSFLCAMLSAAAAPAALEAARVPVPGTPVAGPLVQVVAAGTPQKRKRAERPKIDIDAKIGDLSRDIVSAQKLLKETKTLQRNERRKKQRLVKKASGLSSTDLERIAVIKRCGLWQPGQGVTFDFSGNAGNTAAAAAADDEEIAVTGMAGPTIAAIAPAAGALAADAESDVEE